MTDEPRWASALFTDGDRLRLLQLMTRRAMAERDRRESEDAAGRLPGADEGQAPPADEAARSWRLVPDGTELYAWQRECLPRWVEHGRGTVKVATGGGKTLFALAAAQELQNTREPDLRLVVVVPTIPLMFQWYDEVRRGSLPERTIGLMGGGRDTAPLGELRVLICVLASARERLPALVERAGWAPRMLLVVDECHRANAEHARRIFETRPRYTLGLSATPEQDLVDENLPTNEAYEQSPVGLALGPIIYDFSLADSLAAGLLTPFEVWHVGLPLSAEEAGEHARLSREITELRKALQLAHRRSRTKQAFLAWCQTQASRRGPLVTQAEKFVGLANRRKRLLYRAAARTEVALAILGEAVGDPESRSIVFHESIEEIERLFLHCLDHDLPAVLEHSKLPDGVRAENIDAFRRGVARVIVSARSLVEGFNVPSADLGIIAASSGSVRQRIQSLGRMLRRKAGDRSARIVVLYVHETEDEAIYEKADWETVLGAERNRYFLWRGVEEPGAWTRGLFEVGTPPRRYRPPSWEVDVDSLKGGDPYPGQTVGVDLKVDQSGNLRTDDGELVVAPRALVEAISERTTYGRARCTPAGHLIARVDRGEGSEADWRYLGLLELPRESSDGQQGEAVRLRIRTVSGRRVIARKDARNRGGERFALGPGQSRTPEAGDARERLLAWVGEIERTRRVQVKELWWDAGDKYWLEIEGERIPYEGILAALEFAE